MLEKHANKIAALIGLVVLGLVYWRLMPTLPSVMQDELVYMVQSRHTDPADARFPNYLFSWLYSSSLFFGTDFYNLVKLLNFLFLAGFGVIIYLLAKKIFGVWLSTAVAVASVAGPASLYGSVFMPEAMYIFFASLSFFLVLRVPISGLRGTWRYLLFAGFAMGLTSLVKPHALFLATAFALFFLVSSGWRAQRPSTRLQISGTFIATTLIVKLIGGLLFAGPSGLTLFGGYGSLTGLFQRFIGIISQGVSTNTSEAAASADTDVAMSFFELMVQQFGLHFVAIGFLLAPAWYVFFATKFLVRSPVSELALLTLAIMMIFISAFGAYVTASGDDHSDRVLLRYYEFLIPIVYLGAFHVLKQKRPEGFIKFLYFGIFSTSSVIVAATRMGELDLKIADSAYLLGIFGNLDQLWLYSAALILVFLFILGGPVKLAEYAVVSVSLATLLTGYSVQQNQLDINSTLVGSDLAGQYVRDQLGEVPGEEIWVVGSSKTLVEASIFWMDRPGVTYQLYQAGSVLPDSEIPEGKAVIVQILGVYLGADDQRDVTGEDWRITVKPIR